MCIRDSFFLARAHLLHQPWQNDATAGRLGDATQPASFQSVKDDGLLTGGQGPATKLSQPIAQDYQPSVMPSPAGEWGFAVLKTLAGMSLVGFLIFIGIVVVGALAGVGGGGSFIEESMRRTNDTYNAEIQRAMRQTNETYNRELQRSMRESQRTMDDLLRGN